MKLFILAALLKFFTDCKVRARSNLLPIFFFFITWRPEDSISFFSSSGLNLL